MNNVCDLRGYNGIVVKNYDVSMVLTYYLIDRHRNIVLKGSLNQVAEKIKHGLP
jgi:hypothetical protein